MRYLVVFVLSLPFFVSPAFAQTPTNPDNPSDGCGLPPQGVIVASVTYTLNRDCTQTGALEIHTASTPNVTLTINGMGHTIYNTSYLSSNGTRYGYNFLVVDDEGKDTIQNLDTTASPNIKVNIKNVTFNGSDWDFDRHLYHKTRIKSGTGSWILAEGALTMENVTFTNGDGSWLRIKGTAKLENVLFKDSWVWNWGFDPVVKGILHVANTGSVTLNNAVFRDSARTVIKIDKGGSLSASGCLSFIRVWSYKVHHSGIRSSMGAWSDSSTGPCGDIEIGNRDRAVVPYTLPMLDCGLPSGGTIEGTVVYSLSQDCECINTVNIADDASVTINGNGKRIVGCSGGSAGFRIGNARLTINNANLDGVRIHNYGGRLTLGKSTIANASKPIINYGWAYFHDSIFQENRATSRGLGKVYLGRSLHFGMGRALFQDNVFSNNMPADDEIEAYTHGTGSAIFLCGDNILEGLPEDEDAVALAMFIAENGGNVRFFCPETVEVSGPPAASKECLPETIEPPERMTMGAIGVIFFLQKCPAVIEIWEVLPNSQGKFALKVSQNDVEAVREGIVACSSNGRAAVRVGLTEPVRQKIAHSQAYQAVSPRKARDILISLGPNVEGKVIHIVTDNVLDGQVLGTVDTRSEEPPCQGASLASLLAAAAPPQSTAIPFAAPVAPQAAREDGSIVHVVRSGDTVWQIGIAYDVHPHKIISLNNLQQLSSRGSYIFPGQELLIRPAE